MATQTLQHLFVRRDMVEFANIEQAWQIVKGIMQDLHTDLPTAALGVNGIIGNNNVTVPGNSVVYLKTHCIINTQHRF